MKYTEFIKKMNSLGFSVDTTHPMTLICKRVNADKVVMYISKMRKNSIVINMATSEPNEMKRYIAIVVVVHQKQPVIQHLGNMRE